MPTDCPALFTDEAKVAQILRNLISNALKFTERGEVRVSADVRRRNAAMQPEVADTGIGIAPEDHELVFQEFSQVANILQSRAKGTGLGLPLSRRLAELLGGTLTCAARRAPDRLHVVVSQLARTGICGRSCARVSTRHSRAAFC